MKNLKLYIESHERVEVVTESSSFPLPKLSTILDTTNSARTSSEVTSMTSFLEKLQREQLYRKHQFHRFRQMVLQTTAASTNSNTIFHEDETMDETTSLYDIDIMDMNPRQTNFTATENSTRNNIILDSSLPLTTQMKQRWDVLLLNQRKKTGQR